MFNSALIILPKLHINLYHTPPQHAVPLKNSLWVTFTAASTDSSYTRYCVRRTQAAVKKLALKFFTKFISGIYVQSCNGSGPKMCSSLQRSLCSTYYNYCSYYLGTRWLVSRPQRLSRKLSWTLSVCSLVKHNSSLMTPMWTVRSVTIV